MVLAFYRGEWCPYCDVQLRGYQQALASFAEHQATLIAVSPQTLWHTESTAEQKEPAFPALSDAGNAVARQYGLVYRVDDRVRAALAGLGIDLAAYNGDDSGELPLTASFAIDQGGVIRWAVVEADFRRRPDPAQIVAALEGLARGSWRDTLPPVEAGPRGARGALLPGAPASITTTVPYHSAGAGPGTRSDGAEHSAPPLLVSVGPG